MARLKRISSLSLWPKATSLILLVLVSAYCLNFDRQPQKNSPTSNVSRFPEHTLGALTREDYEIILSSGIKKRDKSELQKFQPAPWLLPSRTPIFPYSGVTDLSELLVLRAKTIMDVEKCVSILFFDKSLAVMTQNARRFLWNYI